MGPLPMPPTPADPSELKSEGRIVTAITATTTNRPQKINPATARNFAHLAASRKYCEAAGSTCSSNRWLSVVDSICIVLIRPGEKHALLTRFTGQDTFP